jgi:hypothetical protein
VALTKLVIERIAPYLRNAKVLSLGYPELLITRREAEQILNVAVTKTTDRGEWHGIPHPLPETLSVFKAMGSTLDCIDIVADYGVEKIVDLNSAHDLGQYDLVIDPGTIEHCFNIGQAIVNAANAVALGGHIVHTPPMTMMNHGFYCICPTMLHDFYDQNGWTIKRLDSYVTNDVQVSATQRFLAIPEYSLLCVAQKQTDETLKWPVQTKYLKKLKP